MSDHKHTCVNSGDCQGMMDARDRAICEQARIIDDLQAEVDNLREKLLGDPVVKKLHYTPEGGCEVEIQHWGVKMIAASVLDTFEQDGGPNFWTATLHDREKGPVEVTVRPLWGTKSTAEVLDELRAELAEVKEERDLLERLLDEVRE